MKALVCSHYGAPDILAFRDLPVPEIKSTEVLIKIKAVSLNKADLIVINGRPFPVRFMTGGMVKPRIDMIPGSDIAGVVIEAGADVQQFKEGDHIFGDLSGCGWGGFAEYAAVPAHFLAHKPDHISFKQAAAVPMAAGTAIEALMAVGNLKHNQSVLIHGASGGVGVYALQIARQLGAEVTAVCSTQNIEQAKLLGADYVIDYTTTDFSQLKSRYDLVLVANGNRSLAEYSRVLAPSGIGVVSGGGGKIMVQTLLLGAIRGLWGQRIFKQVMAKPSAEVLEEIRTALIAETMVPVIEKEYSFDHIISALWDFQTEHVRSKRVVTLE